MKKKILLKNQPHKKFLQEVVTKNHLVNTFNEKRGY